MGRTYRQRSRRAKGTVTLSLSSDPSFVQLTRWMSSREWKQTTSLCLARFSNTGRGLMAKNSIRQGDVLVSIPKYLLITTATVCSSTVGCILSKPFSKPQSFLCQEVLACFLLWEKHLGKASTWFHYTETLPLSFSTPHILDKNHFDKFPWFLREKSCSALELVQNCFKRLVPFFANGSCNHCQLSALEVFTWDSFLWGWCCVNTRAVFIDPEYVPPHELHIKDRNCLALAPYLDMFNHSDNAEVEVGLNSINGCYEIRTQQPIQKFNEVFINYGPHSNMKLFIEYGFILPKNLHDTIPITLIDLREACRLAGLCIQYEGEKIKFCEKHGLISQLYLSSSGFSWNCSTLLKILLCNSSDRKFWEHISYMGSIGPVICDSNLNHVEKHLIHNLKANITESLKLLFQEFQGKCYALKEKRTNDALEVCQALLENILCIVKDYEIHSPNPT